MSHFMGIYLLFYFIIKIQDEKREHSPIWKCDIGCWHFYVTAKDLKVSYTCSDVTVLAA